MVWKLYAKSRKTLLYLENHNPFEFFLIIAEELMEFDLDIKKKAQHASYLCYSCNLDWM